MTPAQIERLDRILDGSLGEPVPGTDFGLVVAALREARAELARVNADFDLTASAAARVVVERDALRARLDAIAAGHREPVREVVCSVDPIAPAAPRVDSVASTLAAFDAVTRSGLGTGSGVLAALRTAARREGLSVDGLNGAGLVAACREHVQPVDVLGLSAASAEAVRSAP